MPPLSHAPYQRVTLYATIRRIVDRFERDDFALASLVRLAQADGFPSGGDGGGRSKGDHSDPTSSAVGVRTAPNDAATKAFDALEAAFTALAAADNARRFALPPNPAEEPPTTDSTPKPVRVDDTWCTSCARVKVGTEQLIFEPRTARAGGRRDLCDWCQEQWLSSGAAGKRKEPDVRLVMLRQYVKRVGGHLTERRRKEAFGLSVGEARKRYLGVDGRARVAPESRAG